MLSVMKDHCTVTLSDSVTESVSSTLQEAEAWSAITLVDLSTVNPSS